MCDQGQSQTYSIAANSGSQLDSVVVDGNNVGKVTSYSFTNISRNHQIRAFFSDVPVQTYTITASAGSNGSISPFGSVVVAQGASQTFFITPEAGYAISQVVIDGVNAGAVSNYTFTNVSSNHTIAASFVASGTSNPCREVNPWDPNQHWSTYTLGDLRTNDGRLWECIDIAYSYLEPSSPHGHYGWNFIANCD